MKTIMPCLLIMVFLCTASMPVFANEQEDDIIRIARKCIREQYPLPNEMIEDMVGFIDDYNEDLETWTVKFKIFDFSSVMFTVEVWEETASVDLGFTGIDYTQEELDRAAAYYYAILPYAITLHEWEQEYGPHQLWSAPLSAWFYHETGHIPGETQNTYEHGGGEVLTPSIDDISLEEALETSNKILMDHFQVTDERLAAFQIASSFDHLSPSGYYVYNFIYYVHKTVKVDHPIALANDFADYHAEYNVIILSPENLCLQALCLDALYENDESLEPPSRESIDREYYSDLYEFVEDTDGSFYRVNK